MQLSASLLEVCPYQSGTYKCTIIMLRAIRIIVAGASSSLRHACGTEGTLNATTSFLSGSNCTAHACICRLCTALHAGCLRQFAALDSEQTCHPAFDHVLINRP